MHYDKIVILGLYFYQMNMKYCLRVLAGGNAVADLLRFRVDEAVKKVNLKLKQFSITNKALFNVSDSFYQL